MKKKILIMLLSLALVFTSSSPVLSTELEHSSTPVSADGMDEQMGSIKDHGEYNDRFIIKYRSSVRTAIPQVIVEQSAVEVSKNVKKESEADLIEAEPLSSAMQSESIQSESIEKTDKEKNVTSAQASKMIDGYDVVTLDAKVEPEKFSANLKAALGDAAEYVQPDYRMELSTNDVTTINLDLSPEDNDEAIVDEDTTETPQETEPPNNDEAQPPVAPTPPPINSSDLLADPGADLESAHAISTGAGVMIAVIDTGIDINHTGLAGKITNGYDFVNDNPIPYNSSLGMEQSHGTHIAGVIAKTAPGAQIMPLKVFENDMAYTSDIIAAIRYAEANGVKIVNCSWGGASYNQALFEIMSRSGMMFICAAGNARTDIDGTFVYPACFDLENIISVASLNADLGFSYYSNYGIKNVDIATYGRDITSTLPDGGYGKMNGTSMAAAEVSSAAALVWAIGIEDIKGRLKGSSYRLSNLQNKVENGNKLGMYNSVANVQNNDIIEVNPADDFDVHGYTPTPEEEWELFASMDNVQVEAGSYHSVVLKEDGTVWSCGRNDYGQLGDGTYTDRLRPVKVVGLADVKKIAAGYNQTFAIKSDGTVWAWGNNTHGLLGSGGYSNETVPKKISSLANIEAIATGAFHTLALKSDGSLWAFGNNTYGQFGNGSTSVDNPNPIQIQTITGLKDISAGSYYTMVLKTDGTVWTWGNNDYGQLGNGGTTGSITPFKVPIDNVQQISAGWFHAAVLKYGEVWSWGNGTQGEMGNGGQLSSYTPVKVPNISADRISAGFGSTIAASQHNIWSWGSNSSGKLGNGSADTNVLAPAAIPGINGNSYLYYSDIAMGAQHTLFLLNNGDLWVCGNNGYGQLGNGSATNTTQPYCLSVHLDEVPGRSFTNPYIVSDFETVNGKIEVVTLSDYYKFKATQSKQYTINVKFSAAYSTIAIYDSNKQRIAGGGNDDDINKTITLSVNLISGNDYFIVIGNDDGYFPSYTLTIGGKRDAESAIAITTPSSTLGNLAVPDDEGWFTFIPSATEKYVIWVDSNQNTQNTIYNQQGVSNLTPMSSFTNNDVIQTFNANEKYYIRVKHASPTGTGYYTLKISKVQYINGSGVVELENAILKSFNGADGTYSYFTTEVDGTASNGKAVRAFGRNPGTDKISDQTKVTAAPLSVVVDLAPGYYYVWIRAKIGHNGQDSIWYSNGYETQTSMEGSQMMELPIGTEGQPWTWKRLPYAIYSTANRINICPREENGAFDKILFTNNASYTPDDSFMGGYSAYELERGYFSDFKSGNITASYQKVEDQTASDGIAYKAVVRGSDKMDPAPVTNGNTYASQIPLNINVGGTYSVWVRAKISDASKDSMWAAFDGNAYTNRGLTVSQGWSWSKVLEGQLTSGSHTLNLVPREQGGIFDKIVVSNIPGYTPNDNMLNGHAVFEMEDAVVTAYQASQGRATFDVITGEKASSGKALAAALSFGGNVEAVANGTAPVIKYEFDVDKTNDYTILFRGSFNSDSDNSVWLSVDNEAYRNIGFEANPSAQQGNYRWITLSTQTLSPGRHVIKFIPRERDGKYDKLIVTNDKYYTPDANMMFNGSYVSKFENQKVTPYNMGTDRYATYSLVSHPNASDGKALKAEIKNEPTNKIEDLASVHAPVLKANVDIDKKGTYAVWVSAQINDDSQDSLWMRFGSSLTYEQKTLKINKSNEQDRFKWTRVYEGMLYPSLNTIDFIPRESEGIFDRYIVTDDLNFVPGVAMTQGHSFDTETLIDVPVSVDGRIGTIGVDNYYKFTAEYSGEYTIKAYGATHTAIYLYDSDRSNFDATSVSYQGTDENDPYTFAGIYDLAEGQTYYIKVTSTSVEDYSISIKFFDIYDYDVEINVYKEDIKSLCKKAFDSGERELSQEIYNKFEMAYDTDLLLHEMPDFLKDISKTDTDYDIKVKDYYTKKKTAFDTLKQTYLSILSEYSVDVTALKSKNLHRQITTDQDKTEPHGGVMAPLMMVTGDEEKPKYGGVMTMAVAAMPELTILSRTTTSITYSVIFPISGATGNAISLIDFNQGATKETIPYSGIYEKNGTKTISGLVPGGMYIVEMHWSTDGGNSYGGVNSVCRWVQLPPYDDGTMTSIEGKKIIAILETADKALATDANFNTWISNMDSVYLALNNLTGYTPYNGDKIKLKSTREDMNWYNPDGQNYWKLTMGYAGNPAMISRPFYRGHMLRLSAGDWGDTAIHETSHDFDIDDWCFDYEVLADLKLSYVLENISDSKIYRVDTKKYYTGSNIYNFFKTDQMDSYDNSFAKGVYNHRGMTAIILRIKQSIGWQAFKDTFRYMSNLSSEELDYIYAMPRLDEIGKFNIFITKLRDFSGQDIISKLTITEKNIIQNRYGGTVAYYTPPPASISGSGQSSINLPVDSYAIRRFTPTTTESYNIFTAPYAGTGAANDTVVEIYADDYFGILLATNDDYGGSKFSKVTIHLQENQTYYIKVKNYGRGVVHTDLKVSKAPVNLILNGSADTQVTGLELSMFRFTPTTSGQYVFATGQYNGVTQTTNKDSVLELYRDEALTQRVAASKYESGVFPQISANLTAGTTYYLTFDGYLSKTASARVSVTQLLTTNNIKYNGDSGPVIGPNQISFDVSKIDSSHKYYDAVISCSTSGVNGPFYEKGRLRILMDSDTKQVQLGNINLYSTGAMTTKITLSYNGNEVRSIITPSPHTVKAATKQPGDVVYQQAGGGKYIYFNNPESVTEEDLLEPELGNKKLMEVKDLTGTNVFYAVFGNPQSCLPYYVDVAFTNDSGQTANVNIENLGLSVSKPGGWDRMNEWGYLSTGAWLNYAGASIKPYNGNGWHNASNGSGSSYIGQGTPPNPNYLDGFNAEPKSGTITVPSGGMRWVMPNISDNGRLESRMGASFDNVAEHTNYALVFKFTSNVPVTLHLAAFYEESTADYANIRNVQTIDHIYSPRDKYGGGSSSDSVRDQKQQGYWNKFRNARGGYYYNAFKEHYKGYLKKTWKNAHSDQGYNSLILSMSPDNFTGLSNDQIDNIASDIIRLNENKLANDGWRLIRRLEGEQHNQVSGVANTLPEVEAKLTFNVPERVSYIRSRQAAGGPSEEDKRFPVRVFNQYNPGGYIPWSNSWLTHMNPQRNEYSWNLIAESDMMGFYMKDSKRPWYFDVYHTSAKAARYGTVSVEDVNIHKAPINPPDAAFQNELETRVNLYNYGVYTKESITFDNRSGADSVELAYVLWTGATAIIKYKVDGREQTVIKPEGDVYEQEVIIVTVPAGQSKTIDVTTLLANANTGPFTHYIRVKKIGGQTI